MDVTDITEKVETVSQGYAEAFDIERDGNWFLLKLQEEVGELTQSYLAMTGQARRKGQTDEQIAAAFRAEVADVFCHTLLLAKHYGIDLTAEVDAKWLIWQRPG